jgi:hypothetical protein
MKFLELNKVAFDEWFNTRPPLVQEVIRKCPPDTVFRSKKTTKLCYVVSYGEDGTVRVFVPREWNPHLFAIVDIEVFGIDPNDLEEADLPPGVLSD